MEHLEMLIKEIITIGEPTVLAVIVDKDSSEEKQEGAWLLFKKGDAPLGFDDSPSLQKVLHNTAEQLYLTGQTKVLPYNMGAIDNANPQDLERENDFMYILVRDIDHNFRKSLISVYKTLNKKEPVLFIQSMEDFSHYVFTSQENDAFGFWDSDSDWDWIDARPYQRIVGQRRIGTKEYFIQLIWPKLS